MVFIMTNEQVVESALRASMEATEALGRAVQSLGHIQKELLFLKEVIKNEAVSPMVQTTNASSKEPQP